MRISTTTIESFRLWMSGDWMEEGELIATIKGDFIPTHRVELGQAFGKVIETPERFQVDGGYCYGSFFFADDVMQPALALFDRHGTFEAKGTKDYGDCTVVAKADQIIGARIIENKATLSNFDYSKYQESYQWRFMLEIFEGAQSCTYHIFCLGEDPEGLIRLKDIESFTLYPYANLHHDCLDMVHQFAEYAKARGLDTLLRERQRTA